MKLIKKIFLFISLIYFSISYDTQYFTCENKIYCDNSYLSFNDLNNLCSTLLSNNRYIIFVSNKLIYPDDNSYTVLSENFFKNYCVNTAYGCKNSFGIFIYIQSGKILIVAGQNVKAYVSKQNRLNVIQTIIPYLQNNNYYTGLEVGIQNLEKILRLNSNESDGGMSFFWIILIILGLGLCLYCVFKSSEKIINQENELNNNNEINNDLNEQLYENNNYIASNVNNNSVEIHNHLIKLQNLINIIRQNSPPIIKINQCLICMQEISLNNNNLNYNNYENKNSNYIEMNNINDVNNNNINNNNINNDIINCRFACQHIYHNSCLIKHNLNYCIICCNNNNENYNVKISNNSNYQILNEENIVSFAKNLNLIYNKNELNVYIQNYSNEFDTFNTSLFLGLTSAWGIVATSALLMNDYNYNNNYNEYNNNYNNNNNYDNNNVDTIGGMYNNNINEYIPSNDNNNMDIKSPNFGKFSNNNNNNNIYGTDFGEEDMNNGDF